MAIGSAIQKGSKVFIMDEKGRIINQYDGELRGYTNSTVTIYRGSFIYIMDEKGRTINQYSGK